MFFKAIMHESEKILEVEKRKMKIQRNKVRIKIITALRSSTYIYKAHTRYISLSVCRRSEKELYNLSYVNLFYSSCLIVRII